MSPSLFKRTISDVCFADRAGRIIIDHPDCHDDNQQIERHVLKKSIQGIAPPSTAIVYQITVTSFFYYNIDAEILQPLVDKIMYAHKHKALKHRYKVSYDSYRRNPIHSLQQTRQEYRSLHNPHFYH